MDANNRRMVRCGISAMVLALACGAGWAEKPERESQQREQRGWRQKEGEWRDYYREREQREEQERYERRAQERAWQDYYRQRQKQGYYLPQPGLVVDIRIGGYFGYPHWVEVDRYYTEQAHRGFCPPGLAKKGNGCLPPGQARAWTLGRPLPPDVVYYPVEPSVRVRLGAPPPGYEFIRVASDILLIAVGTGLVIDAIQDLGRR